MVAILVVVVVLLRPLLVKAAGKTMMVTVTATMTGFIFGVVYLPLVGAMVVLPLRVGPCKPV